MNDKVRKALEERNKRQEENEEKDEKKTSGSNAARRSKINKALAAREQRITLTLSSTLDDLSKRYDTVVKSYKDSVSTPLWGKSVSEIYDSQRENMLAVNKLMKDVEAHRKYLGTNADAILDSLGQIRKSQISIYNGANVISQFNSEEEYNKAVQEYQKKQKEYNDLLNLDQAAFEKEIDVYRSAKEEMRTLIESISEMQDIRNQGKYTQADIAAADARYKELEQKYGYWDEIDDVISEKERYLRNAQRIQEGVRLSSVNDPASKWYDQDFEKYTGYVSTESDSVWGNLTSQYGLDYDDLTYEYINGADNGMRSAILSGAVAWSHGNYSIGSAQDKWKVYDHMHDDEIAIYNYYYAKEGKEAADKYLDSIKETLNMRAATERFRTMEGKTAQELLFAVEAGLDQFDSGIKNLFSKDDYIPASSTQMLSGMVRTDLEDNGPNLPDWLGGASLGQVGYDTITTTANMAPSILASIAIGYINPTAGQIVGAGLLGGSAAGNAYQEKLNLGYSKEDARTYGLMVGTSEAVLQYLLGGIGSLGKNGLSKTVLKNLDSVDNVFARFAKSGAGKVLLSAGSEAIEEGLQSVIEPFLWEAVSGEPVSVDWQEALYSALLGFATGGMFEAGGTAINTASENATAKAQYGESQKELVGEALEIDPSNAFAQRMQGRLDKGKNLSGGQLNRLVQQNESALTAQDITAIQSAVESRLTVLGETGDVSAIAAAITKQATGKKLSKAEWQLVSGNEYAHRVLNELNPENIRSGEYSSSWAEKIDTQRINVDEYSRLIEAAQQPQKTAEVTGEQVVAKTPKMAQAAQPGTVTAPAATIPENQTVEDSTTGKKSLQVAEESSATEEAKTKTVTLEDASKKYGAQAQAMIHTYTSGQDVAKYDNAYQVAYDMGKSGVSFDYVRGSQSVSYLTDTQKELAYEAGTAASNTEAQSLDSKNKNAANGKTGRRKGTVKGEGVTISDLKQTFNDTQGKAYKYLSTVAEVTGIDIVLYRSEVGPDGEFQGAQGRYSRSEPGTIYIDLNAGLSNIESADDLAKYAMLRTFAHEFTHFIENWNPIQYNELRKVVFDTLAERGENVNDLIEDKQARNPGMSYDKASRDVVAEAMTDILPNANFVQELAENHKTIFQKLLDQLKEFVANLRDYFNSIGHNRSKEANALKEQVGDTIKYLDSIVQLFDKAAVQAVENYQLTVATENVALDSVAEDDVQEQSRSYLSNEAEEFRGDIDEWDSNGRPAGETFILGSTGDVLQGLGAIENDVYVQGDKINTIFQEHPEMTIKEIKNLPEILENPVMVLASRNLNRGTQSNTRLTIFGMVKAQNGLPVMVAFDLHPVENKLYLSDMQKVVSAYTKDSSPTAAMKLMQNSDVLYADKEKTASLLHTVGFHNAYRIEQSGYIGNISYENDAVKITGKQFNEVFLDDAQNQQRTNTLTDRDILEIAEKRGITETLSAGQVSTLQIFNKKNAEIGELLKQKAKQEKTLKDLQGTAKPDKQEIIKTQNRIKTIEDQIKRESAKLREYETMDSVKGILDKVKPTVEKKLIEERKEELAKYGTIPQGEKAVRDDSLPVSTDGKNKVSRTARTVKGAGVTPDDFAALIDKEVYLNNGLTYLPITNNATVQKATEYIQRVGWTKAMQQWQADVLAGKASAEMSAIGALLLNNAAKAGDKNTWLDILYSYQMMGTNAAQATQALRILKNLQPDDKLHLIRKSIDQMVRDMHLGFNIEIDSDIEEAYRNAETYEEEDWYLSEIMQGIADQIPATLMDKWTALRYVNMLGNFRTQVRNVIGNLGMKVVTAFKDTVAIGLEQIAHKASGGKFKKTKSLVVSREMMNAAKADYALVESVIQVGGKYSDTKTESTDFARAVWERRTIFKNKLLEGYRKGTNWLMDQGDVLFSKPAYARALAGYLKANGVSSSDFSKVDDVLMNNARLYAVKEAQEATFRDTNILSGWLSQLGRKSTTPAFAKVISEGIVPFRKTPANVLVRAEEYSPLGILNSVWITAHQVAGQTRLTQLTESNSNLIKSIGKFAQSGQEITGAEVINSWAKSLTGTGLFALGMLLHSFGVLVGGPDDDEGLDKFEALNGQQNYALKIGDLYITIDWMSPAAMPLFMGGQLNKLRQEGGIELKDIESALSSIADPLIQMSMLQGVNDTLENIQYAESNMGQLLINSAVSYLTQGLTNTMLGQLERGFEDQRMSTYVNKNSALPNWLQQAIGKASAKSPGLDYNQIPYINAWGQEEQNPETVLSLIYNMLSPSYISKEKNDAVSQELMKLNEVNSSTGSVFPSTPEKTIKSYTDSSGVEHKDYNLSAEEYVALAKAQGQMQRQILESMISSNLYKELPDEYKVKSVQFAYDYARESAQIEVLDCDGFSSDWMAELQDDTAEGIVKHVIQENIKGMFLSGDISADEAIQRRIAYCGDSAEEAAEKVDYWKFQAANPDYADWSESTVTRFKDLDVETASHVVEVLDGLSPENGSTNVRTIQKLEAIAGDKTLLNQDKNAALRAIMDDKLEAKFDSALDMGISMNNFTLAYRKYLDTEGKGKKATVTAYYRKNFGITETKAEKLYDLFAGKK